MARPRLPEAAAAVARIAGVLPDDIFFEIDGRVVFVNWQDSMRCVDKHAAIREAVQDKLPPKYQGYKVVIT